MDMDKLFDIAGKKVIVTGGSRGLGKGMAKGFHDAGCEVVIMGTNEKVKATAEELSTEDNKVHAVICDFSNTNDVERAFYEAISSAAIWTYWSTMPVRRSVTRQQNFRWRTGRRY